MPETKQDAAAYISPPRWSAGRRWALRHWARASLKRQNLARGPSCRDAQNRALVTPGRGFASPWRLPALHFPKGSGKQGHGFSGRPKKRSLRTAQRWLSFRCHAREGGHPAFEKLDRPGIGERSDAVLRTAMPGDDNRESGGLTRTAGADERTHKWPIGR